MLAERGLTGRDAALATELCYGTLRGSGTYDAIVAVCSDRDLHTLEPPVLAVLRLGAHQLLATRIQPHAAVATSVDLIKDIAGPRPAGFVNAILRRIASRDLEAWLVIAAPARESDLVGHLSIRYSHPRWIVTALMQALGDDPAGGLAAGAGARLVAAEPRLQRARMVRAATAASGSAAVVAADGTRPGWRQAAFDRVIADVPCSGLGALRRRPEARWRRSAADVENLGALQQGLLGTAIDSARPGGVVAYVTCSPHLAETRGVIASVLASRDDAEVLDAPGVLADVPGLRCPDPFGAYAQFWPHRHGTDAIFLALLRRGSVS